MAEGLSISGFTMVRNARKLDYPFRESVLSVLPLCDEFIINCGDSSDDTWAICQELQKANPEKIKLIQSVWQKENQKGGWQLKAQTDTALKLCQGKWCIYIQADEAIHESDWSLIKDAMTKADSRPEVDGILFDYLHFYGNYDYRITGRNWYRREVRAFKNGRGVEAYRDAQGFRKADAKLLVIPSEARVFHYGYVRSPQSLKTKSGEMSQWWGETPDTGDDSFQLRRHVGLQRFRATHPAVMRERISSPSHSFDPSQCKRVWDRNEIKNAVTFLWESIVPYRIGEFRNYRLK